MGVAVLLTCVPRKLALLSMLLSLPSLSALVTECLNIKHSPFLLLVLILGLCVVSKEKNNTGTSVLNSSDLGYVL